MTQPKQAKQHPVTSITNCTFNSTFNPESIDAVVALARAAEANAKAIEAVAKLITPSNAPMIQVGEQK